MTFIDSVKSCINNYATFSGRAPRSEYWWMYLFTCIFIILVSLLFVIVGAVAGGVMASFLTALIGIGVGELLLLLPMLSVTIRRLHDTGRSGWWILISAVPLIGPIWFLILMLQASADENEYGLPVY